MSLKQKLKNELKSIGIAAIFFGIWIFTLLIIKSLLLAEYHISSNKWSVIVVGTLVLSKVVVLFGNVSPRGWVRSKPLWMDVILRTAVYTLGAAVVMMLDKGFEARQEYGGFLPALKHLFQMADVYHVWVNVICISGALLVYNALDAVSRHMGKGGLSRLFLSPPPEDSETGTGI